MGVWAYLNGRFIPADELHLEVYDAGFVQGVAVSEQMRTFGGQLFRLDQHLRRLRRSLEIVGLDEQVSLTDLGDAAAELVDRNHALLNPRDDLGLSLFVTPGPYATLAPALRTGPTIGMHTYPLPFQQWVKNYQLGQRLVVSRVRQVPPECWPPELKCRSRMHYFLADREAALIEPGARALLLDLQGYVVEASTANILLYSQQRGLVSPPRESILHGVSMGVAEELAAALEIPFSYQPVEPDDLAAADEILLTSTSPCVWSVTSVDGRAVAEGRPGAAFQKLIGAWSELVGLDIAAQAVMFQNR